MRLIRKDINIPFLQNRKIFFVISSLLLIGSLFSIGVNGINYGIDFAGGYEIQAQFPRAVEVARIKQALRSLKLGEPIVQRFGADENNEYLIRIKRSRAVDPTVLQAITNDIEKAAGPDSDVTLHPSESGERVRVELVETSVAKEQIRSAFDRHGMNVRSVLTNSRSTTPSFTVVLPSVSARVESLLRTEFGFSAHEPTADGTKPQQPNPDRPSSTQNTEADAASETAAIPPPSTANPANTDSLELLKRVEYVGPQVGKQLRNQGMLAIVYALVFILIYIAIRFDFFFSPGAVAALAHDVIITVGIFSLFGIEFNLPIIAALLTIVGYSLNDTIVVYDRVRENLVKLRGREITNLVNTSINETLSRTLLTSATTLLVVLSLLIFGGGIIKDFSTALLIGILIGTYSSVAVASPTYLLLRQRFGKSKPA